MTEDAPGSYAVDVGRVDVVEKHDDIATLANAWDIVMGEAIPRRQSLDLIKEVAKTWT